MSQFLYLQENGDTANWSIVKHGRLSDPSVKCLWLYVVNQARKVPGLEWLDLNTNTSTLCELKCWWDRHCTVSSQKAQAARITVPVRLVQLKNILEKGSGEQSLATGSAVSILPIQWVLQSLKRAKEGEQSYSKQEMTSRIKIQFWTTAFWPMITVIDV